MAVVASTDMATSVVTPVIRSAISVVILITPMMRCRYSAVAINRMSVAVTTHDISLGIDRPTMMIAADVNRVSSVIIAAPIMARFHINGGSNERKCACGN